MQCKLKLRSAPQTLHEAINYAKGSPKEFGQCVTNYIDFRKKLDDENFKKLVLSADLLEKYQLYIRENISDCEGRISDIKRWNDMWIEDLDEKIFDKKYLGRSLELLGKATEAYLEAKNKIDEITTRHIKTFQDSIEILKSLENQTVIIPAVNKGLTHCAKKQSEDRSNTPGSKVTACATTNDAELDNPL